MMATRRKRPRLAEVSLVPYVGRPRPAKAIKDDSSERIVPAPQHHVPPRRGWATPWGGRAAIPSRVPAYRGPAGQIQGLYPWLYGSPLPPVGAIIGMDCLTKGTWSCHPLAWLAGGLISNPNVMITGSPGEGKSALIKTLSARLMAYGIRTCVAGDIKNEYAALARAVGTEPIELGPGLPGRLNPLDAGPLAEGMPSDPVQLQERLAEIHRRRLVLLSALVAMRLGRPLSPTEEAALSLAIYKASGPSGVHGPEDGVLVDCAGEQNRPAPTIPQVWALLRDPTREMARELRVRRDSIQMMREMVRPVTDALGSLVNGSLSGLFDSATTVRPDWNAPIQTIDLSRMKNRGDETVAMIMTCLSTWVQAALDEPGPPRMIVRDELWRQLRVPALVAKVDSDLRLSRAEGVIPVMATHRLADFAAAGATGSQEAAIAANLAASCDTKICFRQEIGPLEDLREQIGLTDTECAHLASWSSQQVGRAVWRVGRTTSAIVQTVLTRREKELFYTNERMEWR